MLKRDKIIVSLVALQAVGAGFYVMTRQSAANPPATPLNVPADAVIGTKGGLRGEANAPYTLVEFGDYQCPPCARSAPKVAGFLAQHPHQVRFQFRHLPLTQIHPFAQRAALIAEKSRGGDFWKTHDDLYTLSPNISDEGLSQLERDDKITSNTNAAIAAKARITADAQAAQKLKINSTPSFVLCCPDGRVLKLSSIAQAENYLH